MDWLEALILGIIQGLTEFLPVSSSGHLEIGKEMLNVEASENMQFTLVVHGATVLSTIVVLRKDIVDIFSGFFKFKNNPETHYILKLLVSMIPVIIIGLLFKDEIEGLFDQNLLLVGCMLLVTATLLAFTFYAKPREKDVSYFKAFLIGIAQAVAVIPGISRSGATIATGLLSGINKEKAAKFSFLMVLLPIIAANMKSVVDGDLSGGESVNPEVLIIGFIAAFVSGALACKWMLRIVKRGKLVWFALYCAVIGGTAIIYSQFFA